MMTPSPWLSDEEVRELCEPLIQPAAQRRFLADQLRLHVRSKKNGRPLIARSELERVLGAARLGATTSTSPQTGVDIEALRRHLNGQGNHGTQSSGR